MPPKYPVEPWHERLFLWYWEAQSTAHGAAADLRFNATYTIRYEAEFPDPGTDFANRFKDRESLVALYAMAARQADLLAEYLCLYRVLEGADGTNGTQFAAQELPHLLGHDFGVLRVGEYWPGGGFLWTNAFELYKHRARLHLEHLNATGVTDIPAHLYRIRNSLAHGKTHVLAGDHGTGFQEAAKALLIIKLLARVAVEP